VKEKPTVVSPFFGTFPSDLIHKETNQLMRLKYPQAAIPENYTMESRELSEGTGIDTCLSHSTISYFLSFCEIEISIGVC